MKKIVFLLVVVLMVFPALATNMVLADGEEPEGSIRAEEISPAVQEDETSSLAAVISDLVDEISEMRTQLFILQMENQELRAALAALQAGETLRPFSIGVMPVENSWNIPEVGDSFREILISSLNSLNEAGIQAVESLDEETLWWVRRQDQLVREGWLDPVSAPRRGDLQGVSHYLFASVIRYEGRWSGESRGGGITAVLDDGFGEGRWSGESRGGGGITAVLDDGFGEGRISRGALIVDFRLVEASSGVIVDAFRTESEIEEFGGRLRIAGEIDVNLDYYQSPLPERAAREVAQQAAERIAARVGVR